MEIATTIGVVGILSGLVALLIAVATGVYLARLGRK